MRFGLALDFGRHGGRLDRLLDDYRPLLDLAAEYGFESVWAGEAPSVSPGSGSSHVPSPFLVLAALAPVTSLNLGTGVILVPGWHPLKLALDGLVLDQVTGGRFILGVGVGRPGLWRKSGIERRLVGAYVDETLQALRALWSGSDGFTGSLVRIEEGIGPMPVQPGGPPIWVGGQSAAAIRRAAAWDAWFAGSSSTFATIADRADAYRREVERRRDPGTPVTIAVNRVVFAAESDERARSESLPFMEKWFGGYRKRGLVAGDSAEDALDDIALVGSPGRILDYVDELERLGVTHLNLRVAPSGTPLGVAEQTIGILGPVLAERTP